MSFLYLTLSTSTFHPFKTHALTNKNTSRLPRKQLSLSPAYPLNLNPLFKPKTPNSSPLTPRAHLTFSLVSPADQWGTWAVLSANGALGIWSEKTEMGSVLEWRGGEHSDGPFGKQFGDYSLRGSGVLVGYGLFVSHCCSPVVVSRGFTQHCAVFEGFALGLIAWISCCSCYGIWDCSGI
ncbi:hypothetical protein Syun_019202 [Stephania yunnanensis]|uniref:Uncharacterized protein n=1 Tax=Stephania yunnanensis TaxID=152371 RepID=A0AAP0NXR5_9MAGN